MGSGFRPLIRGFRVERQEIEATLSTHPDILEAVVETVADAESETDLIAFVAPIAGRSLSDTDTRAWLASLLPHYMVPAAIVVLETLPRTPTGKIDQPSRATRLRRRRGRRAAGR